MNQPVALQLSGAAAERAQHLVATLLREDLEVARRLGPGQDRDPGGIAETVVIGFAVNATYDVVKRIVLGWADREKLDPADISITESAGSDGDLGEWDWPARST